MLSFLKRKKSSGIDHETGTRWYIINERRSIRDNDLKLIRSTISGRRKEVIEMLGKDVITEQEYQRHLDTLNIIEKHALDVVYLRNRERMQELGMPKQRRGQTRLHGVDMTPGVNLEQKADEDEHTNNKPNNT
jgi:hypothetical protein